MATDSILDDAALINLREVVGGDSLLFADLILSFLDDAPRMLRELREGIAEQNAPRVHLNAHSLKGNAADFGALRLAELCLQLERLGKSGQLHEAKALLSQIEGEFPRVDAALRQLLAG